MRVHCQMADQPASKCYNGRLSPRSHSACIWQRCCATAARNVTSGRGIDRTLLVELAPGNFPLMQNFKFSVLCRVLRS